MKGQTQINNSTIRNPNSALPRSWRWVRLGEVIQEVQPGFACGKRADTDGYIQLRMNNISSRGQVNLSSVLRVPATQGQVDKYRLVSGDIIFNNTNSVDLVGKAALFNEEKGLFLYSNHLTRLRTMPGDLDPVYFVSWLQLQWYRRVFEMICNRWIGQAAVQREKLLNLKIPLAPFHEQKRIAAKIQELMQDVERARTACEKQLEAAKVLPAAYLRQVFESEEAKKWERKRLGEVCEVVTGNTPSRNFPENYGAYIPWIKPEDLDREMYVSYSKEYLSELGVTRSRALPAGAVLVSCIGNLGKTAIAGCKLATNQQINSLIPSPQINSEYLYFCCHTLQETLEILASSTTLKIVNKSIFASIEIPLPPLSVQQRIATELKEKMAQIEKLRTGIEKQLEGITTLPQAILIKAFKGEL